MSSMNNFLDNNPYEQGNELNGFETIAQVKIETVWAAGFGKGRDAVHFSFIPDGDGSSQLHCKEHCSSYIAQKNLQTSGGKPVFPNLGILTTIPIETNLTASENLTFDIVEFASANESHRLGWPLTKEDLAKIEKGTLPYDAIITALGSVPGFELGQLLWVRLEQIVNQFDEAQEYRKNEEYPNRIHVLREVYATQELAYAAANVKPDSSDDFGGFGGEDTEGLSARAIGNNWTKPQLERTAEELKEAILERTGQRDVDGNKISKTSATMMICEENGLSVADLKFINISPPNDYYIKQDEVPF